jgi:HSP20 family protein
MCRNRSLGLVGEFDRIADSLFSGFFPARAQRRPGVALNAWEEESRYCVEAEVPGLALEDLEISIEARELTFKGERKADESAKAHFHRRERGSGSFERTLRLPEGIDAEKIQANLEHGVLTIELPKAEALRPRRIEIRSRG